jgi:nucleotide-binding universal stress UspA family protein
LEPSGRLESEPGTAPGSDFVSSNSPAARSIETVLVGVDGSADAFCALEWSILLARCCGARVLAVHAAGLLTNLPENRNLPSQSHRRDLKRAFDDWCSALSTSGVVHSKLLEDGPPVLVLSQIGARAKADVIVVGRGSGTGREVILGSTSLELVESSPIPIVIVPPA